MARSIKIRGIEPPDLNGLPVPYRRQFWQIVAPIALRVKDKELAAGLDAKGEPLKPISAAARKHRRSAMTPDEKGDPSAPPLMPARQKSRTRSLLAARAMPTHVELYWRFDPFTGDQWGAILEYQKKQGRDVFGISDAGLKEIRRQSWSAWAKWKKSGADPEEFRRSYAAEVVANQSAHGPQARIAQMVAGSAVPHAGGQPIPTIGGDRRFATAGQGGDREAGGQYSGGLGRRAWQEYLAGEVGKKGKGKAGGGVVVIKPPKPRPPKPPAAKVAQASTPPAPPKPPKPKPDPGRAILDQVDRAEAEFYRTNLGRRIDPAGKIADRIAGYTVGDAKLRAIAEYSEYLEKHDPALKQFEAEKAAQFKASQAMWAERGKLVKLFEKAEKAAKKSGDYAEFERLGAEMDALSVRQMEHGRKANEISERETAAAEARKARVVEAFEIRDPNQRLNVSFDDCKPGASSPSGPLREMDAPTRANAVKAREFLSRVTRRPAGDLELSARIGMGDGYRAHFREGGGGYTIQVKTGENPDVLVHEFGHAYEAYIRTDNPAGPSFATMEHRSHEFRDHRVKGEKPVKFNEKFPDSKYEDYEIGAKDEFDKVFSERLAYYVGKDYGRLGNGTEILSMGIQKLYNDPVGFAKGDPEYCKFVLGMLDGSLR